MNIALIDSVFLSETSEEFFYAFWEDDNFCYGGHYEDGALCETLIALYESEPKCRPDLIEFAVHILKSTDS